MSAGVEQAMKVAGLVAAEDDRPSRDLARAEVARLLQLGRVPDIDPAAAENLRHLLAQNLLRHQNLAVEQEGLLMVVVDDVRADGHSLACPSILVPLAPDAAHTRNLYARPKRGQFDRATPIAVGSAASY